jgi:hypothetical protein
MTAIVICPECHHAVTVLGRFTQITPSGVHVEYLRIRCTGLLTVLVTADELKQAVPPDRMLAAA